MRRALAVVVPLALAVVSCDDSDPEIADPVCSRYPVIPIHARSGALVVRARPQDFRGLGAYADVCRAEDGPHGEEILACRPTFTDVDGVRGSFAIIGDDSWSLAVTRRGVRITSNAPDLSFEFDLPDVRSLDGVHAWSSGVFLQEFNPPGPGACHWWPGNDPHAVGLLNVVSRSGGVDAENVVTDDYHAVVEVAGRVETVWGNGADGPCVYLPETVFSFTYEEDEVTETGICLL